MVVRQVVIPVSPDQLWDALTEPESVSAWFGSQVEWDLRPGGAARFWEDDGTVRGGVIVDVRPGRHLRFRWWPELEGPGATSEVNYDLEPEEEGTRLTVTEEAAPAPAPTGGGPSAVASALASAVASAVASVAAAGASWSDWDSRLFRCWAWSEASGAGRASLAAVPAGRRSVPSSVEAPAGRPSR